MSKGPEKNQRANVNTIWVLTGGYLVYLAARLLIGIPKSDTPIVAAIGGLVFLAVGGAVLLREWKAYKYGMEHIDDPSTWSVEEEELQPELMEEDALSEAEDEIAEDEE